MALTLIPAIDLRGGRCVRLLQGRLEDETVFSEDPVATARGWQAQGAPRLHVVDLDGAFGGRPAQTDSSAPSSPRVGIPVQVGGGLRDAAAVQRVLDAGARWAVVGTRAALDPAFLGDICGAFPGQIIVSVDASDGKVAVDGWKRVLELEATTWPAMPPPRARPPCSTRTSPATAPSAARISGARRRWRARSRTDRLSGSFLALSAATRLRWLQDRKEASALLGRLSKRSRLAARSLRQMMRLMQKGLLPTSTYGNRESDRVPTESELVESDSSKAKSAPPL